MTYVNETSVAGTGIAFIPICVCCVALRFGIRRWKRQGVGADDWISLAALVFVIGVNIVMIVGALQHTMGAHGETKKLVTPQWKATLAIQIFRDPAMGLTKLSVLFLYRRLFFVNNKPFQIATWAVIIYVTAWMVVFELVDLFECGVPVSNLWTSNLSKCVDEQAKNTSHSVFDILADLMVLALPIEPIWHLRISVRKKLLINTVFVVGTLSLFAAVFRLAYNAASFEVLEKGHKPILGINDSDIFGSQSILWFWHMVEVDVAMVATCMPTFGPLVFEADSAIASLRMTMGSLFMSSGAGTEKTATHVTHHRLRSKPSGEQPWAIA